MKRILQKILNSLGLQVLPISQYVRLSMEAQLLMKEPGRKIIELFPEQVNFLLEAATKSRSQLGQEILALALRGGERGFFVEFGATNGIDLSNTFVLETVFNWNGILAEPSRYYLAQLKQNRRVAIDHRAVWESSRDKRLFGDYRELGTLIEFRDTDYNSAFRRSGRVYPVETVTLIDLLREHNAPKEIDYLSIDTEGSEYAILKNFDFEQYAFRLITVEHNFNPNRNKVFDLLTKNGYDRILTDISDFDDWYVNKSLVDLVV